MSNSNNNNRSNGRNRNEVNPPNIINGIGNFFKEMTRGITGGSPPQRRNTNNQHPIQYQQAQPQTQTSNNNQQGQSRPLGVLEKPVRDIGNGLFGQAIGLTDSPLLRKPLGDQRVDALQNELRSIQGAVIEEAVTLDVLKKGRSHIVGHIKAKIELAILNYLKRVPDIIKDEVVDKDMCGCVKWITKDSIDNLWPDVQEEIIFQLRLRLNEPNLVYNEPAPKRAWYSCCCEYVRAWFRYTYMPADRSIWYRLKTFGFWLFTVIQIMPFYAVQPLFRLLIWLMMDKSDEFQLVFFIMDFKALQFFTLGCLGGIINYLSYYNCVVIAGGKDKLGSEIHQCAARSPSDFYLFIIEVTHYWFLTPKGGRIHPPGSTNLVLLSDNFLFREKGRT